jgi:hypothetical protein
VLGSRQRPARGVDALPWLGITAALSYPSDNSTPVENALARKILKDG